MYIKVFIHLLMKIGKEMIFFQLHKLRVFNKNNKANLRKSSKKWRKSAESDLFTCIYKNNDNIQF